jgi:hypothetical protein
MFCKAAVRRTIGCWRSASRARWLAWSRATMRVRDDLGLGALDARGNRRCFGLGLRRGIAFICGVALHLRRSRGGGHRIALGLHQRALLLGDSRRGRRIGGETDPGGGDREKNGALHRAHPSR